MLKQHIKLLTKDQKSKLAYLAPEQYTKQNLNTDWPPKPQWKIDFSKLSRHEFNKMQSYVKSKCILNQ